MALGFNPSDHINPTQIFAAVLEYAFPEDGDLVAAGIHSHGTDQASGSGSFLAGDRPVLAELEGIVIASPPAKKVSKLSCCLQVMLDLGFSVWILGFTPTSQSATDLHNARKDDGVGQADWATT